LTECNFIIYNYKQYTTFPDPIIAQKRVQPVICDQQASWMSSAGLRNHCQSIQYHSC